MVNTYYPPAPSAKRCVKFGQALASILRRFPGQERVVMVGSGGLSHTKISEPLDYRFLKALETTISNTWEPCRLPIWSRAHPRSATGL